jgi:hypothetical protein
MDINFAFGKYLALSREILDFDNEKSFLENEKKRLVSDAVNKSDVPEGNAMRLLEIYEKLKLIESEMQGKKELLVLPNEEIVQFFKENHPIKFFRYKEEKTGNMVLFTFDGTWFQTNQLKLYFDDQLKAEPVFGILIYEDIRNVYTV